MQMQKELNERYAGVIERWKVDLAFDRIKAMGFPVSDWPDLMQELAISLLAFRYDPEQANGAGQRTAVSAVVQRRLLHLMRSRCRRIDSLNRYAREMGVKGDDTDEEPCCYSEAPVRMDVVTIRAGLGEFDRKVLSAFLAGHSRSRIARRLGCDWHEVDRAVRRIRQAFVEAGFEGRARR